MSEEKSVAISLKDVHSRFDKFKLAAEQPRLYVHDFFENLKNEIDIQCYKRLDETNKEQILKQQACLIDEVDKFSIDCLEELSKTMNVKDNEFATFIEQIKSDLKTPDISADELQRVYEVLTDQLMQIESALFQNKSMYFVKAAEEGKDSVADHFESLSKRANQTEHLGSLILVEDCYIRAEEFKENCKHLNKQRLKSWFSLKLIKEAVDAGEYPIVRITEIDKKLVRTKEILLRDGRIEMIVPNLFEGFSKLKVLNLSNNKLLQIDSKPFTGLSSLTTLSLSNNQLVSLDNKPFEDLTSLISLYLSNNKLVQIDNKPFTGLSSLTTLNLSNNRLVSLDNKPFEDLTSLISLNLNNNKLVQLDNKSFSGLNNMISLSISINNLVGLDHKPFMGLTSLQKLYLNSNQLVSLGNESFRDLINLKFLYLYNNQLNRLDNCSFAGLSSLKELELGKNKLIRLENKTFDCLSSLTSLNLRENELGVLSDNPFRVLFSFKSLDYCGVDSSFYRLNPSIFQ